MLKTLRPPARRLQETVRLVLVLLTLAGTTAGLAAGKPPAKKLRDRAPELPPLNRGVLDFARGQVGRSVGDGECTALAVAALSAAGGARPEFRGSGGDYVWGEEVTDRREVLPGDILQFRAAVFRGRDDLGDGRWFTWRQDYPHHTAVVAEVRGGGKTLVLLHQNTLTGGAPEDDRKLVKETTLRVDALQPGGRVWVYRPQADGP